MILKNATLYRLSYNANAVNRNPLQPVNVASCKR